jgi:sugar phosphate isomerase/epimerase
MLHSFAEAAIAERPPLPALGLDGFKTMAGRLNDIGGKVKAVGLQYAYHNHNFEFEKIPDGSFGYDILLRETDHDLVKFEADCGWMVIAGAKPARYFRLYPGRFRMLHVKDFQREGKPNIVLMGPGKPLGMELGNGFIDYKPIFAAGKAAGIEHALAEQEAPYVRSQMESAKVSYQFFHSFS